jgi:hypothetical protein
MKEVEKIATAANRRISLVDNAIWLLCAKSGLYLTNSELASMAHESGFAGGQAEAIRALTDSWAKREDHEEQQETLERLIQGLDRDRLSDCRLFPEELKGTSW